MKSCWGVRDSRWRKAALGAMRSSIQASGARGSDHCRNRQRVRPQATRVPEYWPDSVGLRDSSMPGRLREGASRLYRCSHRGVRAWRLRSSRSPNWSTDSLKSSRMPEASQVPGSTSRAWTKWGESRAMACMNRHRKKASWASAPLGSSVSSRSSTEGVHRSSTTQRVGPGGRALRACAS